MSSSASYGTNLAFIDELYEKYKSDPRSVSESWQEFFHDYEPAPELDLDPLDPSEATPLESAAPVTQEPARTPPVQPPAAPAAAPAPAPAKPRAAAAPADSSDTQVPLRGVASKIVQNMESSLTVPTATSVRTIPVKVLEENRRTINHHLSIIGHSKASFTHVVAWAIVKAVAKFPRMNSSYREIDGVPTRIDHENVNLGLAVDVEKKDGSRSLVVPNVKGAQAMDFAQFLRAYNDIIRKSRSNALEISDFEGTSISLTNPGTIGTLASIPRLMQTQGTIVATGQIAYPAEYAGSDPEVLAELGVSKIMTMTSTYDHRIIQGAESGEFLALIHSFLLGGEDFYDGIFRDLDIPYEPARWSQDRKRWIFNGSGKDEEIARGAAVRQLINAYRVRGHLIADLDPLEYRVGRHPELNPAYYGLTIWDYDREVVSGGLGGGATAKLRSVLEILRETYCGRIGPEYMYIQDPGEKRWLQEKMEPTRNSWALNDDVKRRILKKLNDAEAFERFLHTKFVGHKRFSLEGAETLIPMVDHLLTDAARAGVEQVVIGMAHRGRLNVLANILSKSYEKIFNEFDGDIDPDSAQGSGDVKYHLGAESSHVTPEGGKVRLTLASNPSHLEAVDPIVEGMVRARQKVLGDKSRRRVMPLLIHGDAAFAGQGVVAETLNLSQLKGYRTGGTVHIVVNNQIGFTTGPEDARSSQYATDVAKMVQAPTFHVNGDDPEACIRAITLAFEFRQKFRKDVVIDLICYRRLGHNEGDDPSLTQPRMYKLIKDHRSVRKLYTEALIRRGDLSTEEAEKWLDEFRNQLQQAFDKTRNDSPPPTSQGKHPLWTDEEITGVQNDPSPATAITEDAVERIRHAVMSQPEGFVVHPKLKSILDKRRRMAAAEEPMDWGFAESMAFGSLLIDGHRVRLSGQDSGRGTFSHRHAVIFDYNSGKGYIPLNALSSDHSHGSPGPDVKNVLTEDDDSYIRKPDAAGDAMVNFSVYDSLLSEYGVLGFEYGYSVADPETLVLWEAQFGDFMNGAQIVIDQFISSAEEKWGQHSGLVMLLPHGYEGQGPEHSSARLERFLILCAEGNMGVVNLTTPAQYFHVLRRQMAMTPRKPLVVMTPKSLLRHPSATSTMQELTSGRFQPVLDDMSFADDSRDRNAVRRVVLCSGKLYYDLLSGREAAGRTDDVAIVRVEQLYPWPQKFVLDAIARYPQAEVVWAQEEPRNMGAWGFVRSKFTPTTDRKVSYVGRPISAAPATGSARRHEAQQQAIVGIAVGAPESSGE